MTLILKFIASYMGYLWKDAQFRITGSEVSTSNGGDALLMVESAVLELRFTCDRGQLFLDFRSVSSNSPREWFSVDLLRRLHTGKPETSAVLDESYATFVGEFLPEIAKKFAPEEWPETLAKLKKLRVQRSREMFG